MIPTLFVVPFFTFDALHPVLIRRFNKEVITVNAAKLPGLFHVTCSLLWLTHHHFLR